MLITGVKYKAEYFLVFASVAADICRQNKLRYNLLYYILYSTVNNIQATTKNELNHSQTVQDITHMTIGTIFKYCY